MSDCVRCGESPPVTDHGLCGHCFWVIEAEIVVGLRELNDYLAHWAKFSDWCAERGVPA